MWWMGVVYGFLHCLPDRTVLCTAVQRVVVALVVLIEHVVREPDWAPLN